MHDYEVEDGSHGGSEADYKTWTEVVGKDCCTRQLNKEDAMDYSKWS